MNSGEQREEPPETSEKRWDFTKPRARYQHLKNFVQLLQYEVRYSDHP